MKLTRARITNYKSIDDSGWVDIQNVTCFVGKNESGKTAFLQALKKLNPVGASGDFGVIGSVYSSPRYWSVIGVPSKLNRRIDAPSRSSAIWLSMTSRATWSCSC